MPSQRKLNLTTAKQRIVLLTWNNVFDLQGGPIERIGCV